MTQRTFAPFLIATLFILGTAPAFAQPDNYSAPEKDWYTITTKHFFVHFHEGAEHTARVAAKVAEEVYGPITSLYNHEPDTRVSLIMKDISDYSNGAAYFFNNKIEIWASPLDFELRGTHNWLRNVIAHEFTHIIQIQSAMKFGRSIPALTFQWFGYEKERRKDVLYGFPNLLVSYPFPGVIVPPWFAEGTAQFQRGLLGYEHWDAHRDMILRSYVLTDSMLSWGEMSAFGKTSLGNESVYNAGYNLTRYIAQKYGEDKLPAITREMSKPFVFTVDAAIDNVLGKSGKELYNEWAASLKNEYEQRIAPVLANRKEGEIIAQVGFGNFHPEWSPDGSKLAYVSNKTSDYFGQSAIYIRDSEGGEEKMIAPGVRSTLGWSPDGTKLVYSKYNDPSVYGHLYYDLYTYDLKTEQEEPLTRGLRAFNPSWSADGKYITFAFVTDGTINLGLVNSDGSGFRALTSFTQGEQIFTPKWAPDGSYIVFGYSSRTKRQVARVNPDGSGFTVIIAHLLYDCRDPRVTDDGKAVLYVSDRAGIFNIYRHELEGNNPDAQLTNVVGGAFMPDISPSGDLVYADYTASGYKLALLRKAAPLMLQSNDYLPSRMYSSPIASTGEWDWDELNAFDDTKTPEYKTPFYERLFQSMMYFPTIRVDEYNPDNKGLDLLKPGLMMYGTDVLNRLEFLASASINLRGERDLYLNVTYRDKLPLFSSLGLYPDLMLEVYNVTRSTSTEIPFPLDTVGVDVDFNLLAFAVRLGHNIASNHMRVEFGYTHNRYTSTTGQFRLPDSEIPVPARDNLYLVGNDLSASFRFRQMLPTRDREINPVGVRFSLSYNYEFNNYNPDGDYEIDRNSGMLVPLYKDFNFHRFDANLLGAMAMPWGGHTLSMRFRAATILGEEVDDFFNFYAGGITGMQGYTYYALGGNELATAQLTYRFPIIPSMDLRVGHIFFDKLYGGLFFDIGDAVMAPDQFTVGGMKKDVGFELRLESFSFSMYPTRVFFSGAYGLDEFTRTFQFSNVTYGKEWRWYFGVLFGFDLTDGF
ncbi:MAG: PD40 domain-containing protein [Bacteroidetes bacterium]|nr:PD40 domain-containing protein [Bacteroidota bacterium]